MGKLIVYSSKANKQLFDLPADCNTVGRDHGNAIRIRHSSVSGKH